MSLPLPYGEKHTGVERAPPPSGGPRPYAERLREAPKLVEKAGPSGNTLIHALPGAASILLIVGAFAPVVLAHPAIREFLFQPLVDATSPFSAGLAMAADAIWTGWGGALVACEAGIIGFVSWRLSLWNDERGAPAKSRRNTQLVFWAIVVLLAPIPILEGSVDAAAAAAAAWVVATGAVAAYGAWHARARSSYQISLGGAVALMLGGRLLTGGAAVVLLALGDNEFPGQDVAKYSWRHSKVSVEPVRPAPAPTYTEADWGALHRARWATPWAPPLIGFVLLVGALVPFGYWGPFRSELFGPLVDALQPATAFVPIVSDAFWSLDPVYFSYILVMSVVAIAAARFSFGATRPRAVLAGALALIASGRVIAGAAVLALLLISYSEYGQRSKAGEHAPTGEGHEANAPAP